MKEFAARVQRDSELVFDQSQKSLQSRQLVETLGAQILNMPATANPADVARVNANLEAARKNRLDARLAQRKCHDQLVPVYKVYRTHIDSKRKEKENTGTWAVANGVALAAEQLIQELTALGMHQP